MKITRYILALLLAASTVSCNDWLTVMPSTQIEADKLVRTNDGLRQALAGVYTRMRETIYHPSRTYGLGGAGIVEKMAGSYNNGAFSVELAHHAYNSSMDSDNESQFITFYNIIANANAMLNNMVKYEEQIQPMTYNIVRGEGLGLRALLHFDLLRIYGSSPKAIDPAYRYLPYVSKSSPNAYPYHTFEEFSSMVLDDLDEAERLLKDYDPVLTEPFSVTEVEGYNWQERKSRMNYYGVLGLKARVHLWLGNNAEALRYAKMVKDAMESDGSGPKFRLTTLADMEATDDRLYYTEHLTGTKVSTYDIYKPGMVDPWVPRSLPYNNTLPVFVTFMTKEKPLAEVTDIRYTKCIQTTYISSPRPGRTIYTTAKYMGYKNPSTSPKNFPIMRLAEIYFMLMELGTLDEANALYEEYCAARNMAYEPMTAANRETVLRDEFIREYYGEGQTFFYLKRLLLGSNPLVPDLETPYTAEGYRLPLPMREQSNLQ